MAAPVILGGVQVATQVVGTIAQINDANKRRDFDFAIGRLSLDQQMALERDLSRAADATQRLAILTNAIAMIRTAETTGKLQNKGKAEEAKRKKEMLNIALIVGGGIAAIFTVILLRKL
jgi:hypothetical protein